MSRKKGLSAIRAVKEGKGARITEFVLVAVMTSESGLAGNIQQSRKKMNRRLALAGALAILLSASGAFAQEVHRQEISAQGTGFFTKDSSGNGINQHATDTAGFLLSYRYHFNAWLPAGASYGYARNTQQNFTSSGAFNIQADAHQPTGALVVSIRHSVFKLNPYVLAGTGALIFDPTGNIGGFVSGASNQAKAVFVYGDGADYDLSKHFAIRAEYRGIVYGQPDFGLAGLHSGATTHTAQPSAGIVFRF